MAVDYSSSRCAQCLLAGLWPAVGRMVVVIGQLRFRGGQAHNLERYLHDIQHSKDGCTKAQAVTAIKINMMSCSLAK
jgi:hypothetical protein